MYDPATTRNLFLQRLQQRGVPAHAIAAVDMNVQDESSWDPYSVGDNGAAIGLIQWNGPRAKALRSYAAARGAPWQDPLVQADFFMQEAEGPEQAAWNKTLAAPNAGQAGAAFVTHYERPAEENRRRRAATYSGGSYAGLGVGPTQARADMGLPLATRETPYAAGLETAEEKARAKRRAKQDRTQALLQIGMQLLNG